jgi:hypothetical protein
MYFFQGATIVDQIVNITPAEDYIYIPVTEQVRHWAYFYCVNVINLYWSLFFMETSIFKIMQQLLVREVTSTSSAPNAELEYSPEVPLNPSASFFSFLLPSS